MRTLASMAGILALALAAPAAQAADFVPLMDTVHATWPEKTHIGVVADYQASREAIEALAAGAGAGSTITVLDIRSAAQLDKAGTLMVYRVKPDFLVLLPEDRLVRDGSFNATLVVNRVAAHGIPAVATTPAALRQGAAFAVGEGTGFELMVTHKLIGTVEVILPKTGHYLNTTASFQGGSARISVVGGL